MSATHKITSASVQTSLTAQITKSEGVLVGSHSPAISGTKTITFGTSANQAEQGVSFVKSDLAASASHTVNLSTLQNFWGVVAWSAGKKVKALALVNESTDSAPAALTIGPAATSGFSGPFGGTAPTVRCPQGGVPLVFYEPSGYSDDLATNHSVTITNLSATNIGKFRLLVLIG